MPFSILARMTESGGRYHILRKSHRQMLELESHGNISILLQCCTIDDNWHCPSSSVILVFLRVAEFKRDTPVDGQYFNP